MQVDHALHAPHTQSTPFGAVVVTTCGAVYSSLRPPASPEAASPAPAASPASAATFADSSTPPSLEKSSARTEPCCATTMSATRIEANKRISPTTCRGELRGTLRTYASILTPVLHATIRTSSSDPFYGLKARQGQQQRKSG